MSLPPSAFTRPACHAGLVRRMSTTWRWSAEYSKANTKAGLVGTEVTKE
jgi:hypothetical protein